MSQRGLFTSVVLAVVCSGFCYEAGDCVDCPSGTTNPLCKVGSCSVASCFPWRGPADCTRGKTLAGSCGCEPGTKSCIVVNKEDRIHLPPSLPPPRTCVTPKLCDRKAGASCNINPCHASRGPTECVAGYTPWYLHAFSPKECMCKEGFCATEAGTCVPHDEAPMALAAAGSAETDEDVESELQLGPEHIVLACLAIALLVASAKKFVLPVFSKSSGGLDAGLLQA